MQDNNNNQNTSSTGRSAGLQNQTAVSNVRPGQMTGQQTPAQAGSANQLPGQSTQSQGVPVVSSVQQVSSKASPAKNNQLLSALKTNPAPNPSTVQSSQDAQPATSPSEKTGSKKLKILMALLVFLFVLMGILGALVFFQNDPGDQGEPTDTEGEIVWWGLEDAAIYAQLIRSYESENPNIKITYVQQSTENYRERLTSSLAKGEGPDVFTYHNSWVPMFANELDVIPSFVMSQEDFADRYYPIVEADLKRPEGIVGIPLEYDGLVLYINEDIFASAGITIPVTWDEFKDTAKLLTQRDSRGVIIQSGVSIGVTENIDHWQELVAFMIFQNHGAPSSPSSKEAREALSYYTQIKNDGNWSGILPQSTIAFANGDVAMFFGTVESASEIMSQNPNLNFKAIPLPQIRRDDPDELDASFASYWVQGVWKRSRTRGVAWRFLDFLSSRSSLEQIYKNAEIIKFVGDPYPHKDMAPLLKNDRFAGNLLQLAPYARSWYLADKTNDGPTGINTQFADLYEPVVNGNKIGDLVGLEKQVNQILVSFGLKK